MQCPRCSEVNKDGTRFCKKCGAPLTDEAMAQDPIAAAASRRSRRRWIVLVVLIAGALVIAMRRRSAPTANENQPASPAPTVPNVSTDDVVKLGIAYGTEKQEWLTWAAKEFAATAEGRNIQIDLRPMGSLEAAQAIVHDDKDIHVWSPASALYKDVFLRDWADRHGGERSAANPIAKESPLALTPMVFVMWQERYDAFHSKYQELSFPTIGNAMSEKSGWDAIAGKPDWMFFKFSHTNPNQSNSGLMALVLMGYDYHGKHAGLDGRDLTDAKFQAWMQTIERGLTGAASGLVSSTGYLMTSMIQRGWSTYDVIFVYEASAIERLQQANGRWGPLRVVYPKYNMWNENPYYVLNVPWSDARHRKAAETFLQFLLSDRVQQQAMQHGFRPANLNVPTNGPESPLVKYADTGLQANVPGVFCEPPKAEVIENLLLTWQRSQTR